MIAIGIDCTSGDQTFTYAALDRDLRLVNLAEVDLDGLAAFVSREGATRVAVNAPSHVNAGLVRKRLASRKDDSHGVRGAEIREAEHDLHARGISVTPTPRLEALCQGWVQLGFGLYRRLEALQFKPYPADDSPRQWLETHPHAGFCALLGRLPLSKPSLEGRLQRALALFERGVRIHDPMAFLEEITRHRLLNGLLPMEVVLSSDQLDAILAAYTAWLTETKPHEVSQFGNRQEGFITLPVPQLQEKY
jgi:hypothetical protein